jgi:hypothetical protein
LPELKNIVDAFEPISLSEMEGTALLDRTDTKFMLDQGTLIELLKEVQGDYRILEVKGIRMNRYKTLYFDTPDLDFYHLHQNGKKNRHKVRSRKYLDSDLCFLEVKFKNNKGRTIKQRVVIDDFELDLSSDSQDFILKASGIDYSLVPAIWNSFTRITLVSKEDTERLTIDLNLGFQSDEDAIKLDHLVILEVKQPQASRNSKFIQALKRRHVRPDRISKYCLGVALLKDGIKRNAFKSKILKIEKLDHGFVE